MNLHLCNRHLSVKFLLVPLFVFIFLITSNATNPFLFPNLQLIETIKKEATAYKKFKKVEKKVLREIGKNITYPEIAFNYGIEGTVKVQFYFDGKVSNVKILESVGGGCDQEVLQALADFPKLYQAKGGEQINGANIVMRFRFNLD